MVVARSTPKATPNSPQLELEEVDNETRSNHIQDRPQKRKPMLLSPMVIVAQKGKLFCLMAIFPK